MHPESLRWLYTLHQSISNSTPRPGLHPNPDSQRLTVTAAILPPVIYYLALLLLAPPPPPVVDRTQVKLLRSCLALLAGVLFFRLPLVYHVTQSIGLTYQLGLVGLYGGCRVLDAFFISPYLSGHIPRRVKYRHSLRNESSRTPGSVEGKGWTNGGVPDPFHHDGSSQEDLSDDGFNRDAKNLKQRRPVPASTATPARAPTTSETVSSAIRRSISGPSPIAVTEVAETEIGWPTSLLDRAAWALELELSMRGIGFTWTTADVRHTRHTWLPTIQNRIHSILVHVLPVLLACWVVIRVVYVRCILPMENASWETYSAYDLFDQNLPLPLQLLLTAALGAFLMAAFSFGHSLFAIMLNPLAPSPLAFFSTLVHHKSLADYQCTQILELWMASTFREAVSSVRSLAWRMARAQAARQRHRSASRCWEGHWCVPEFWPCAQLRGSWSPRGRLENGDWRGQVLCLERRGSGSRRCSNPSCEQHQEETRST